MYGTIFCDYLTYLDQFLFASLPTTTTGDLSAKTKQQQIFLILGTLIRVGAGGLGLTPLN